MKTKKKYWYFRKINRCVSCGSETEYRERRYTPKPKDWQDRCEYHDEYAPTAKLGCFCKEFQMADTIYTKIYNVLKLAEQAGVGVCFNAYEASTLLGLLDLNGEMVGLATADLQADLDRATEMVVAADAHCLAHKHRNRLEEGICSLIHQRNQKEE